MTVKQLLYLMEYEQEIVIRFYAYGQDYACTSIDGLNTVGDCIENLTYDCSRAKVIAILPKCVPVILDGKRTKLDEPYLYVKAELVHN